MTIQLHKCAHIVAFVLKTIQNFIDLDACKQKSAIKKLEIRKKNHKSIIFLE